MTTLMIIMITHTKLQKKKNNNKNKRNEGGDFEFRVMIIELPAFTNLEGRF